MKEKNKYHVRDYMSIVLFCTIFACFFVASIMGIVDTINGNLETNKLVFRILLTIVVCLPYIIKKIFRISFSKVASSVFYLYMFFAGFLGVVLEFYSKFEWWDILIHFLMGLCLALLSIFILNLTVYKKDTSSHNLFFTFMYMIMFTLAVGAVWEIFEFIADGIFGAGFQRYVTYEGVTLVGRRALVDTMVDLIMDLAGAILGVTAVNVISIFDKKFLKTFKIKRLKKLEEEIENIEE